MGATPWRFKSSSRHQIPISITLAQTMDGCAQNEPFALQVTDQVMEPEFPQGCIIIIEPNGILEDGCYVVADLGDGFIFRKLTINPSGMELDTLSGEPNQPVIVVKAEQIRGRVIQRAGKKRKDRKHYL